MRYDTSTQQFEINSNCKNFKVLNLGLETNPLLEEYNKNLHILNDVEKVNHIKGNFYVTKVLPLILGTTDNAKNIYDSESQQDMPWKYDFPKMLKFLAEKSFLNGLSRCGYFFLSPDQSVGMHQEIGEYYLNRNRFHISMQGVYEFWVERDCFVIQPGTLFWFNSKKEHDAYNISDVNRIAFVFDCLIKETPEWCKEFGVH